jgi:hypothetical protein
MASGKLGAVHLDVFSTKVKGPTPAGTVPRPDSSNADRIYAKAYNESLKASGITLIAKPPAAA